MSDQSGGKTSSDAQSQKAETTKDESSQDSDVKPTDSPAEQDSLPGKGVGFPNIHFISSETKRYLCFSEGFIG